MLPLILQHVRELAESQSAEVERDRYKIITPFPPSLLGWPDFDEDALSFNDRPLEGESASADTLRAFDFFMRTDSLYYDFSYGIKSDDYLLSQVCQKFFLNAQPNTADVGYQTAFFEKRDAFLNKYARFTVGDLGELPYKYTSLSPLTWNGARVRLDASDVVRLRDRAIAVYEELDGVAPVSAVIAELRSATYSAIEFDVGSFDVIRGWMDPHLFDGPWQFASGGRVLYGETDPSFESGDVRLCFAQRFYLVKNCTGQPESPPREPPHRRSDAPGGVVVREGGRVRDRRRAIRNELIGRAAARLAVNPAPAVAVTTVAAVEAKPPPRPGFVWVPASGEIPGHWERERARGADPVQPPRDETTYKVAALKCRVLPQRP